MADIAGIRSLRDVADGFLFKYKLSMEDGAILFEHTCNCYRDIRLRHGDQVTTESVTVDANGIIEMPTSMMTFVNLGVYKNDEFWSFTMRPKLDITEESPADPPVLTDGTSTTYGSSGGQNDYYYVIDWQTRRIFCAGIYSDTAVLKYVGTGISASADTLIPEIMVPVIDAYLLWKKGYWDGATRTEMMDRKEDYDEEVMMYRKIVNGMSGDQIMDILWGTTTQGPKR